MSISLELDTKLADRYKSSSQKARVMTEEWVKSEVYCPSCGNLHLKQYSNNKPVADFFCDYCSEDFELKSKGNALGAKIVDGAYSTMLDRLSDAHNPNFFLLNYDLHSYQVSNFLVIPKHFFVPYIIEKRSPLSPIARRAGWIGCNILLSRIPESGRIFLIKDKQFVLKENVYAAWKKTLFLREEKKVESKGWLLDIMLCIESIRKKEFSLEDVYKYETALAKQHPDNKHIKDKVRQQLQILRDRNYLQFMGRGEYRVL
jgi:type II restriction enzyme